MEQLKNDVFWEHETWVQKSTTWARNNNWPVFGVPKPCTCGSLMVSMVVYWWFRLLWKNTTKIIPSRWLRYIDWKSKLLDHTKGEIKNYGWKKCAHVLALKSNSSGLPLDHFFTATSNTQHATTNRITKRLAAGMAHDARNQIWMQFLKCSRFWLALANDCLVVKNDAFYRVRL